MLSVESKIKTVTIAVLFFVLLFPVALKSQNFTVNGDASAQGGGCYELTPNASGKTGSIWSPNKVSLTESFIVTGRMNFGLTSWFAPRAGDGIAFALQPVSSAASSSGGGMGVQGINPALVVEFDHYENSAWGDPTYHHAAIIKNGEPDHLAFPPLDGPVQINPGSNSVTDGQWYDFKFEWDVTTQKFTVDINCQEILSYTGDIIQNIFGGISDVHWGFASATGNKYSQHQVCVDATNLFEMPDQSICLGDTATVALSSVGNNYSLNSWNPTAGIIDHTAPNVTFSPSVTTEYVVTFTDDCGDSVTDTFNLTVDPAPTVSLGNDTNVCGTANLTLDAANAGSTYLWNTAATSQSISTTGAGAYNVKITNPAGCSGYDTIVVGSNGGLTVSLGSDSAFCGPISLNLDASNTGSTYLWNSGATSQSITATTAGSYFVEVTSASGCKGYDTLIITQATGLTVALGNDTTICDGNTVSIDAGNVGSTYLWSTGANGQTINASTTGSYFVEVTSTSGCKGYDTINVTVNVQPVVSITPSDTVSACTNSYPIALNASVWLGTYEWNDGSTGSSINATSQGDYWVILTVLGCSDTDSVYVKDIPVLALNLGNDTIICGTSYILDGGAGHTAYEWQEIPANNTQNFTASTAGSNNYILKITNAAGCEAIDTINITLNPQPTALDIRDTSLCAEDLPINIDATQGGVTYLWNDASTNPTLSANVVGDYWVIVTQNNCSDTDSITVILKGAATVNLGNDTTICTGASLILDASNAGSTYLWSNAASAQTTVVTSQGQYYVDVTNSNGCLSTDSIQVNIGALSVNLGLDTALCPAETFVLDATTANATYLWNTTSTTATINASSAGTYSVIVTNSSGCQGKDTVIISTKTGPVVSLGTDLTICTGSSTILDAGIGAGYTYLWNTTASTQTISVTTAGTYFVGVAVAGSSCIGTDTIVVQLSPSLPVNLPEDTTLCDGVSLNINSNIIGATYLWSNAATTQDITVNAAGTYHVLVTDANNCEGRDTVTVSTSTGPSVNIGKDTTSCNVITMTLDAQNPGNSFLWNTGSSAQSITITAAGTYFVDVTNVDHCTTRDSILVGVSANNTTVNLGKDSTFCNSIFYTVNAGNPGSTYLWNTTPVSTGQSINISSAGTYHVKVTDANNCVGRDTVVIDLGAAVVLDLGTHQPLCEDSILVLDAKNLGAAYTWSDGSHLQILAVSVAGTYEVEVTNSDGCKAKDDVVITYNSKPVINMTNSTHIACGGDSVVVTTGNTTDSHLWSDGTTNDSAFVTSQHGTLSVTITNALGCTNTGKTVPVTFNNVSIDLNNVHYHCTGTTAIINPNRIDPNYEYAWGPNGDINGSELSTTVDGTHILTAIRDLGGKICSATSSTQLVSVSFPTLSIIGDTTACEGESITIEAISSGNITWSNGIKTNENTVLTTDTYFATASLTSSGRTCLTKDSLAVTFHKFPDLVETPDLFHCFEYDRALTIFTDTEGANYEWEQSNSTAPIAGVKAEGIYSVKVYNDKNCVTTQEITVTEKCPISLYVPNSFTPNNDGLNELFTVVGHNAQTFELLIFNRWGETVFKSTDGNVHWDGTFNGYDVQEDVYVWQAKVSGYDENYKSKEIHRTGTVTLVR